MYWTDKKRLEVIAKLSELTTYYFVTRRPTVAVSSRIHNLLSEIEYVAKGTEEFLNNNKKRIDKSLAEWDEVAE